MISSSWACSKWKRQNLDVNAGLLSVSGLFIPPVCVCVFARWVNATAGVADDGKEAADRRRTATDNDVRSAEQPGKVTG